MSQRASKFSIAFAAIILLLTPAAWGLEPLPMDQQDSAAGLDSLPQLPPISGGAADNAGLPPLPGNETPIAASQGMPPLPSGGTASNGLPPLPGQTAAPSSSMPPLPDPSSAAPMDPGEMPPLPSEMQAYEQKKAEEAAKEAAKPAAEKQKALKKAAPEKRPWERTKKRVNTIFGGWVRAKGGNETSRIAWASQEAMNALALHGFKILKEDGLYEGQRGAAGNQWRLITFRVPGSERTLEIFVRQIDTRVWMRIGPSEPPPFSIHSVAEVKKIRGDSLKALKLVRKEMGKRFRPHRAGSWEAPYSYSLATADKKPIY